MIKSKTTSRSLINIIGIPLLLGLIYFGGFLFTTFIYIAIFLSTIELGNICKIKGYSIQSAWLYIIYIYMYISHYIEFNKLDVLQIIFIIFLLTSIFELFRKNKNSLENIAITLLAFIWIGISLEGIIHIREIDGGREFVYCIFLSVWICDSAAFIFGSKFGRKKIASNISPNKTWVGTISGYLFSAVFILCLVQNEFFKSNLYIFTFKDVLIMGFIVGIIGQLGDFFESMVKREFKIKDSSTLLQGHGGMLDRLDSLLFVIPSFYIYLYFIL